MTNTTTQQQELENMAAWAESEELEGKMLAAWALVALEEAKTEAERETARCQLATAQVAEFCGKVEKLRAEAALEQL